MKERHGRSDTDIDVGFHKPKQLFYEPTRIMSAQYDELSMICYAFLHLFPFLSSFPPYASLGSALVCIYIVSKEVPRS